MIDFIRSALSSGAVFADLCCFQQPTCRISSSWPSSQTLYLQNHQGGPSSLPGRMLVTVVHGSSKMLLSSEAFPVTSAHRVDGPTPWPSRTADKDRLFYTHLPFRMNEEHRFGVWPRSNSLFDRGMQRLQTNGSILISPRNAREPHSCPGATEFCCSINAVPAVGIFLPSTKFSMKGLEGYL